MTHLLIKTIITEIWLTIKKNSFWLQQSGRASGSQSGAAFFLFTQFRFCSSFLWSGEAAEVPIEKSDFASTERERETARTRMTETLCTPPADSAG
jgi:predicted choloylglycine hydrolase